MLTHRCLVLLLAMSVAVIAACDEESTNTTSDAGSDVAGAGEVDVNEATIQAATSGVAAMVNVVALSNEEMVGGRGDDQKSGLGDLVPSAIAYNLETRLDEITLTFSEDTITDGTVEQTESNGQTSVYEL